MRIVALAAATTLVGLAACAAPLQTEAVSFPAPESVAGHQQFDGLVIAAVPIANKTASVHMFGTDMAESDLLPVQIVAQNRSAHEFEIDASQAFAIGPSDALTPPLTLSQAAATARASSIGSAAAADAFLGALAGAAAGAAIGAGAGAVSGSAGNGAAYGAGIGAAVGGTVGVANGTSDAITVHYEEELGAVAWGDQVLNPGDIKQGIIFLRRGQYRAIQVKLLDVTAGQYGIVQLALSD